MTFDAWLVVVRNDEWTFPDIFGPFEDRAAAELFAENTINHKVVRWEDINIQAALSPRDYDEEEYE
jgi:hypothetical protein